MTHKTSCKVEIHKIIGDGTAVDLVWIPVDFAIPGKELSRKVKNGVWDSGWFIHRTGMSTTNLSEPNQEKNQIQWRFA